MVSPARSGLVARGVEVVAANSNAAAACDVAEGRCDAAVTTALATRLIWRYGMPQEWKVPQPGGRP